MLSMQHSNTSVETTSMETNEKKPSYDILEWFPILYCQDVFKHLTGKDLIQASTVNKEWYKLVAEKPQMKKLKIVFDEANEEEWNDEAEGILKKSKRKYGNVEFKSISFRRSKFCLEFLAQRAGSWKSVTMKKCTLKNSDTWFRIFKIIEPTVEELTVASTKWFSGFPKVRSEMVFPHLKSLVCKDFEYKMYRNFIYCQNLINFHWEEDDPNEGAQYKTNLTRSVFEILQNNHGLKDTDANDDVMSAKNSFRFKLEKLRVTGEHQRSREPPENLFSFLKSQAQNLESLDIQVRLNRNCLELILTGLPTLTSFRVNIYDFWYAIPFWEGDQALPVNTTITSLELKCSCGHHNAYKAFTRALCSLKHFKSDRMDGQLLLLIAGNVPALESIEVEYCDTTGLTQENIFPKLQKFKVKKIIGGMREPAGENNFSALVAKEIRKHRKSSLNKIQTSVSV